MYGELYLFKFGVQAIAHNVLRVPEVGDQQEPI
jgi:hypothetical protein